MRGQGLLSGCSRGGVSRSPARARKICCGNSWRSPIRANLIRPSFDFGRFDVAVFRLACSHIPGASTAATQEPMGTSRSRAFYVRGDFSDLAHNSIQQRKTSHSGRAVSQACLPDYRQSSFVRYVLGRRPFRATLISPACRSAAHRLGSRPMSRVQASLHSYDAAVDRQIDARDVAAFVRR